MGRRMGYSGAHSGDLDAAGYRQSSCCQLRTIPHVHPSHVHRNIETVALPLVPTHRAA